MDDVIRCGTRSDRVSANTPPETGLCIAFGGQPVTDDAPMGLDTLLISSWLSERARMREAPLEMWDE